MLFDEITKFPYIFTLEALSKAVAGDILFLLLFVRGNKAWHWMWIDCQAYDLHEML